MMQTWSDFLEQTLRIAQSGRKEESMTTTTSIEEVVFPASDKQANRRNEDKD